MLWRRTPCMHCTKWACPRVAIVASGMEGRQAVQQRGASEPGEAGGKASRSTAKAVAKSAGSWKAKREGGWGGSGAG